MEQLEPLLITDTSGRGTALELDPVRTPRALLVLFRAQPVKRVALRRLPSLV
jgi:hypothetical protein